MSSNTTSSSLLQSPLVKPLSSLLFVVFLALFIFSAAYFALSYMADTSSDYDDLIAEEDNTAPRRAFSVVAVVSVVGLLGLVIGGVLLRDGNKSDEEVQQAKQESASKLPFKKTATEEMPKPPAKPSLTKDNKTFSGDALIQRLYRNLPHNAIILCDLEVEDKFEECTVLDSPVMDLKGVDAEFTLISILNSIREEKGHFIAKCCTDTTANTVMFTTMAKNPALRLDSTGIGIEMQDCLNTDCALHTMAKMLRNQLYQKMTDSKFKGCQPTATRGSRQKVQHTVFDEKGSSSVGHEIMLECPPGFQWDMNNLQNAAMLYKYTLATPLHKLDRVYAGPNNRGLQIVEAFFNCEGEGDEITQLSDILTQLGTANTVGQTGKLSPPPEPVKSATASVYSGDDLISLYEKVPENTLIHCDLEVKGKFEECTVLSKTMADLNAAGALESTINQVLTDKNHFIAKCCTDKTKNIVMFTTMVKDKALGPTTLSITLQDCLDTECKDHLAAKITRNRLYQKLTDATFSGCSSTVTPTGALEIKHITATKSIASIRNLYLQCPPEFKRDPQNLRNAAMLYKFALTSPRHKLAVLNYQNREQNLETRFNCKDEKLVESFLGLILNNWKSIKSQS